jgi:hypothetical protein
MTYIVVHHGMESEEMNVALHGRLGTPPNQSSSTSSDVWKPSKFFDLLCRILLLINVAYIS